MHLVCFSHAGAGASTYRSWLGHLPAHIALDAVQLPGRESRLREGLRTDLGALSVEVADAIQGTLRLPFAFFGHSMGALLAYEVAQRLEERAVAGPTALFVSGRRAPHVPACEPALHACSDVELVSLLDARYGGIPSAILDDAELRRLYVPILRADLTAVEQYEHVDLPPLACPIRAFGGRTDALAAPVELDAWRHHTTASFESRVFEGGHFFVQTERAIVARAVVAALDEVV